MWPSDSVWYRLVNFRWMYITSETQTRSPNSKPASVPMKRISLSLETVLHQCQVEARRLRSVATIILKNIYFATMAVRQPLRTPRPLSINSPEIWHTPRVQETLRLSLPVHCPLAIKNSKYPIDLSQAHHWSAMGSASPTHVPYRLDGKVALVTGSSRGIGAAMAVELARCGAKIVINYANSAGPAEKVVQEIKSLGSDAIALKADVSQVKQTVQLFDEAVKHFGQLDIVCSNSGVVSFGHLEDVTEVSRRRSGQAMPAFILTRSLHRRSLTESSTSTLVANFLLLAKRTSTSTREDVSFSWAPTLVEIRSCQNTLSIPGRKGPSIHLYGSWPLTVGRRRSPWMRSHLEVLWRTCSTPLPSTTSPTAIISLMMN